MTLPTPPKYVVLPEEVIEQAYAPDKPRRALLASFTRILSLAWEAKYERTPRMNEEELMDFLKLSRRQYYEQKADMELLGWLRSSHPVPGFVQFTFGRSIVERVALPVASAENRTDGADSRTGDSSLIGGGESLINLKTDSTPPIKEKASAENRTFPSVVEILKHTDLLFDGSVVISRGLEDCIPQEALAWCAYAYYQFKQGRLAAPGGVVRNRLKDGEHASEKMRGAWREILPEEFLEALGLVEYACHVVDCDQVFDHRTELDQHIKAAHPLPHICEFCMARFGSREAVERHIAEKHDAPIAVDESVTPVIAQAWKAVLDQLQADMPKASFETWVMDTQVVRYDGNALSIGVRNAYAQDWLASRLTITVERLLNEILDRRLTVQFVVSKAEVEA
jgi:hypothetical protein